MNANLKHIVLFYPTGIVHFRNLEILKKNLPGFRFLVIIEPWVNEKAVEVLGNIDVEDRVPVENGRLSRDVWGKNIDILFLSMAYPNPFRLHLVYEAIKRNIPVTAIEEVNQLALNDGIINHYFLPLDVLGVPSAVEKEKFTALGVPGDSLFVTGWPFFNEEGVLKNGGDNTIDIKEHYEIPHEKKCCLLVLGSLKEHDMVSLETRKVRHKILEIVSGGLGSGYQLLVKPHPIETKAGLLDIKLQVPDAIILNPKDPIESLLAQSDIVVNRGNSQVTLLAMMQNKPVIVVPVGLKTIFHGVMDTIVCGSAADFKRFIDTYAGDKKEDYKKILGTHFPLTQEQALVNVKKLFQKALEKKINNVNDKKYYTAILYAFLGYMETAKKILCEMPEDQIVILLEKLFNKHIDGVEFRNLSNRFRGKILRWHLQALFIRVLSGGKAAYNLTGLVPLLKGFDGEVNPHYFIEEIIKRIELEYRAGSQIKAGELIEKFYDDYAIFAYHKQAFDMLRYVYHNHRKGWIFRKTLWLLKNFNKAYTRKYIKDKLIKK